MMEPADAASAKVSKISGGAVGRGRATSFLMTSRLVHVHPPGAAKTGAPSGWQGQLGQVALNVGGGNRHHFFE